MTTNNWLEIDLKGFAQILRNKGIARIALEPISNAFDTEATEIQVSFTQKQGKATLFVKDDDPDGFADLREAYTLYAPSRRREDSAKRGRFGQGDKELIAICYNGGRVEVASTTGTVLFTQAGRVHDRGRTKEGTTLTAEFRCNQAEATEFSNLVRFLLVPNGVKLTFNGEVIQRREPTKVVNYTLATVTVDAEGNLTDTQRKTDIELIEPAGETPVIYELGVPVVEHDGRWHINVGQKVPLNSARDNVKPSYLRKLREIMLNETHDELNAVDMKSAWVNDALPKATEDALRSYVEVKHGKNAVIYDPSNPEASKRALDEHRPVVYGGQEQGEIWDRIKHHEILKPAGQVIPTTPKTSPDGIPPIPREEWTGPMFDLERYVQGLGKFLLGYTPRVQFEVIPNPSGKRYGARFGGNTITFNLGTLGKKWPETADQYTVDALILHEFTHNWVDDHLCDQFINRLADLGARSRDCKLRLR